MVPLKEWKSLNILEHPQQFKNLYRNKLRAD
jgi:hypothetical protein